MTLTDVLLKANPLHLIELAAVLVLGVAILTIKLMVISRRLNGTALAYWQSVCLAVLLLSGVLGVGEILTRLGACK